MHPTRETSSHGTPRSTKGLGRYVINPVTPRSPPPPRRGTACASSRAKIRSSRARTRRGIATGRARTATGANDLYLVAVIENRAKEVGMAAYNLRSFDVELRQFTDTNTFVITMTLLTIFAPVEVVLSASSVNGVMHNKIRHSSHFAHTKMSFISRRYFNETSGAVFINRLNATPCPNLATSSNIPKYLAIASCGALLKHVETTQNYTFQRSTLRIRLRENDGILSLDVSTIEALELIHNQRAHTAANPRLARETLLGVLDKTKTRPGKRLLRKSLLEPCSSLETIRCRQDVIDEMIEKDEMFFGVTDALTQLPDLEATLAFLIATQLKLIHNFRNDEEDSDADSASAAAASIRNRLAETLEPPNMNIIRNLLLVKKTIDSLPKILTAIGGAESLILRAIAETLRSKPLDSLRGLIHEVFEDDAMPAVKSERMRLQSAFAVRTGRNGILDVARKTLSENISDMHSHLETLKERYDLPKLAIAYNAGRGYHFTIPARMLDIDQLPDEFIQLQKGKVTKFSTDAMTELNARYRESLNEIWLLSTREVSIVLEYFWKQEVISELHRLCDAIALLDLLTSFVSYISLSPHRHSRPTFSMSGAVAIKNGHNVILASLRSSESVPNDVFLGDTTPFHVITGPNMAGKSTLIKSVGLIVILAHTGCFVPADYVAMRLLQRLCTRIGREDSIEDNQSSFSREMTDMSNILKLLNNGPKHSGIPLCKEPREGGEPVASMQNSLVLIDELGRATAHSDGFALSHALAEELCSYARTFAMLTTHFTDMCELEAVNPSAKCFHLEVKDHESTRRGVSGGRSVAESAGDLRSDDIGKQFTYRVARGVTKALNYGFATAATAGLPQSVIADAHRLLQMLPGEQRETRSRDKTKSNICGRKASYVRFISSIAERLWILKHVNLDEASSRTHLKALQNKVSAAHRQASTCETCSQKTREV